GTRLLPDQAEKGKREGRAVVWFDHTLRTIIVRNVPLRNTLHVREIDRTEIPPFWPGAVSVPDEIGRVLFAKNHYSVQHLTPHSCVEAGTKQASGDRTKLPEFVQREIDAGGVTTGKDLRFQ